ncbi:hypothetical protein PR048_025159 [Dryococelus australis]|uniref:Tc1-like transposase DDE domain-containing protein n=1 Tax=Dryococelus australis TaxID=614101 RepID=A0ABQ9GQP1_9NEOP|nr:hypothetical protein PR048_025159 [Dryococelus australis]
MNASAQLALRILPSLVHTAFPTPHPWKAYSGRQNTPIPPGKYVLVYSLSRFMRLMQASALCLNSRLFVPTSSQEETNNAKPVSGGAETLATGNTEHGKPKNKWSSHFCVKRTQIFCVSDTVPSAYAIPIRTAANYIPTVARNTQAVPYCKLLTYGTRIQFPFHSSLLSRLVFYRSELSHSFTRQQLNSTPSLEAYRNIYIVRPEHLEGSTHPESRLENKNTACSAAKPMGRHKESHKEIRYKIPQRQLRVSIVLADFIEKMYAISIFEHTKLRAPDQQLTRRNYKGQYFLGGFYPSGVDKQAIHQASLNGSSQRAGESEQFNLSFATTCLCSLPARDRGSAVVKTTSILPRRTGFEFPAGSSRIFAMWESCRTMQLVGGFSRGSPVSPVFTFKRCSILTLLPTHGLSKPKSLHTQCCNRHTCRSRVSTAVVRWCGEDVMCVLHACFTDIALVAMLEPRIRGCDLWRGRADVSESWPYSFFCQQRRLLTRVPLFTEAAHESLACGVLAFGLEATLPAELTDVRKCSATEATGWMLAFLRRFLLISTLSAWTNGPLGITAVETTELHTPLMSEIRLRQCMKANRQPTMEQLTVQTNQGASVYRNSSANPSANGAADCIERKDVSVSGKKLGRTDTLHPLLGEHKAMREVLWSGIVVVIFSRSHHLCGRTGYSSTIMRLATRLEVLIRTWLEEHDQDFQVRPWPANSSVLNPIEYLWGHLDHRVRRLSPSRTLQKLWDALEKEWLQIPVETYQHFTESLPALSAIRAAKGARSTGVLLSRRTGSQSSLTIRWREEHSAIPGSLFKLRRLGLERESLSAPTRHDNDRLQHYSRAASWQVVSLPLSTHHLPPPPLIMKKAKRLHVPLGSTTPQLDCSYITNLYRNQAECETHPIHRASYPFRHGLPTRRSNISRLKTAGRVGRGREVNSPLETSLPRRDMKVQIYSISRALTSAVVKSFRKTNMTQSEDKPARLREGAPGIVSPSPAQIPPESRYKPRE